MTAARLAGADAEGIEVESAAPYRGIVDVAARHGCDPIFMASQGRKGTGETLPGSKARKVLIYTRIPLPVYH